MTRRVQAARWVAWEGREVDWEEMKEAAGEVRTVATRVVADAMAVPAAGLQEVVERTVMATEAASVATVLRAGHGASRSCRRLRLHLTGSSLLSSQCSHR